MSFSQAQAQMSPWCTKFNTKLPITYRESSWWYRLTTYIDPCFKYYDHLHSEMWYDIVWGRITHNNLSLNKLIKTNECNKDFWLSHHSWFSRHHTLPFHYLSNGWIRECWPFNFNVRKVSGVAEEEEVKREYVLECVFRWQICTSTGVQCWHNNGTLFNEGVITNICQIFCVSFNNSKVHVSNLFFWHIISTTLNTKSRVNL